MRQTVFMASGLLAVGALGIAQSGVGVDGSQRYQRRPTGTPLAITRQLAAPVTLTTSSDHAAVSTPFLHAFGFDPFTPERMPDIVAQEAAVRRAPGFAETVRAGKRAVAAPDNTAARHEFQRHLSDMMSETGGTDILAMLYYVFRESIREQEENKRYWLRRLRELNQIADAMSDCLEELGEASSKLAEQEAEDDEDSKVEVRIRRWQVPSVASSLRYTPTPTKTERIAAVSGKIVQMNAGEIQAEIATVQGDLDTVRSDRQMCASQFENANQKATQYVNMLSSILKTLNEMQSGIIRNLR